MRALAASLVWLAACGRIDFDGQADAQEVLASGFDFPNFTTCPATLVFQGAAQCVAGDDLNLTTDAANQLGAVWVSLPFVNTPTTQFALQITFHFSTATPPGGDGAAVIFSGDPRGTAAIASLAGGSLGYAMIAPSAALELDTFLNTIDDDINANHLGIDRDGSLVSITAMDAAPVMLADGTAFTVWFDYDGPTSRLDGYVAQTPPKPAMPLVTTTDDLTRLGSSVWIGVTSSTGVSHERHDLLAWRLDVTP